jgi:hypothetical protein
MQGARLQRQVAGERSQKRVGVGRYCDPVILDRKQEPLQTRRASPFRFERPDENRSVWVLDLPLSKKGRQRRRDGLPQL